MFSLGERQVPAAQPGLCSTRRFSDSEVVPGRVISVHTSIRPCSSAVQCGSVSSNSVSFRVSLSASGLATDFSTLFKHLRGTVLLVHLVLPEFLRGS